MENKEILAAMVAAEREGAALMLQAHDVLAEAKTDRRNVVTEYDRAVQTLLMQRLTEALPGARFFCEEMDQQDDLGAEHLFIIDPIDGTMNFVHGLGHSCISIAYCRRGVREAAAICNPYRQELFTALRGAGAWLNGRPLHAAEGPLAEGIVCFGSAPYNPELAEESFRLAKRACLLGLDIRREGSAALDLCSAASGRAGLYFELSVSLWDYAAGSLIVEEAGGVCTRVDGSPLSYGPARTSILAGSPQAAKDFLSQVLPRP